MPNGYGQFCPIAKASEIFAARWTPLILRELMAGTRSFNDIQRGVPLISRAVLVTRLRELQNAGIIDRRRRPGGGHDYLLTPAGEDFRPVIAALGKWGTAHARDRIAPAELDPGLLMWALRGRALLEALPDRRVVVRFEFSGVPASRTKYRIMWLLLERSGASVCVKDPGFTEDLIIRGDIRDCVSVHLGYVAWRDVARKALSIEGDRHLAAQFPAWLGLMTPAPA
ncbi:MULTISPECIES: helix-turn-helix domain-containing protein [Rhodomicrobium]|uniref:winged helix-turn-helix transcriptional regulator n=1 Tax=Rhodomicrobium TaxID=1068 RepID=UPI000B4A64AB|nr:MULTISPECIES: helix-turn-helix domain-containing protein [Rhodomicrobium]